MEVVIIPKNYAPKIDFLWTEISPTSANLDGFSWFKLHITLNIGQNILVMGNLMWFFSKRAFLRAMGSNFDRLQI